MGCDIHFYVEKRVDGAWVTADTWAQGKYDEPRKVLNSTSFYTGRSYDLFAILANVRNGSGFAGCDTGDGFVPIAEPRGVPDDACPEYLAEVEQWGVDGHSHQWLTLAEILAFDWTQETTHRGWVGPLEWARWRDCGKPDGWSGGISGSMVAHVAPADFEAAWRHVCAAFGWRESYYPTAYLRPASDEGAAALKLFLTRFGGKDPYSQVEWREPYCVSAAHFWSEAVPRLLRVGAPDDVRCVFFFDN